MISLSTVRLLLPVCERCELRFNVRGDAQEGVGAEQVHGDGDEVSGHDRAFAKRHAVGEEQTQRLLAVQARVDAIDTNTTNGELEIRGQAPMSFKAFVSGSCFF